MTAGATGTLAAVDRRTTVLVSVVVALTGASALALQVGWQRVMSMHSGLDAGSTAVVVAAFLAGLGIGSLAGGSIADRLGPRRSLVLHGALDGVLAVLAALSVWVLDDLYRAVVPPTAPAVVGFAGAFAAIVVPTTLMGTSLPLLVRSFTARAADAAPRVGWLVTVNTVGAAAGAMVAGWWLIGSHGLLAATRAAAAGYAIAALGVVVLVKSLDPAAAAERAASRAGDVANPQNSPLTGRIGPDGSSGRSTRPSTDPDLTGTGAGTTERTPPSAPGPLPVGWWYAAYGLTGAVALGMQAVYFRVVDATMRSNAYSFALVLALYLLLWSAGTGIGAAVVRRVSDPAGWFVGTQLGVAIGAGGALVLVFRVLPHSPVGASLQRWFTSDGLAGGFFGVPATDTLLFAVAIPLLLMGPPVLLAGVSLPFAQRLVSDDLMHLGRRTGILAGANLAGNVAGILVTTFVLLDRLGSGDTYRLLVTTLAAVALVLAVALAVRRRGVDGAAAGPAGAVARRRGVLGAGLVAAAAMVLLMPGTTDLWHALHGDEDLTFMVEEDRSCASTMKVFGDGGAQLSLNGASQNGHPYDDFHVLLGLLPSLVVDDPDHALAVGLGIGSTTAGMLGDPRLNRVTTVEICGGNERLLRRLASDRSTDADRSDVAATLADPRTTFVTDDGRSFLHATDERYDLIATDTMRPTSATSGLLYSVDYFRLLRDHLTPDGVVATWIPTGRVLDALAQVFPHVVMAKVPTYNDSVLAIAGNRPVLPRLEDAAGRLDAVEMSAERRRAFEAVLAEASSAACAPDEEVRVPDPNRDLEARDEYFLNNPSRPPAQQAPCPG